MKQNRYINGNKGANAKYNKSKGKPQKRTITKSEVIEETLEQRLNRVIENNKAISELIIGYVPYPIQFVSQTFAGTTNKPEKISAFEKAIVGIISIDGQSSLSSIGKILGLDIEHDIAEQKMIRRAIDTMMRYQLVKGDESAYFITEQGKEFAAHGERMRSFNSDFELWYFNDNHSFADLRNCVSADDIKAISDSQFLKDGKAFLPLSFEEIKSLAEVQASNMQSSKERFILQEATPKDCNYYAYDFLVCFVQSIRTKHVRAIVYDDNLQKVIPQLSGYVDNEPELKQNLFSSMLCAASENENLAIYDNFELAIADPLIKEEDRTNILSAERKLIEQEERQNQTENDEGDKTVSNPDDLSERLHKRALYDSITFESELHNIFQVDKPDEIWLASPWVGDSTFIRNRLPLIKNYLKKGGKVFISYSESDGGLDSHKDKMVGDQSQKALDSLEIEYPKQFFHVELPAFHKKNVIEVKNGQCVLFTGSFNVLSFSVTAKNITHVRAEEMCLAHYQAAIKQYNESKLLFAKKYIEKSLSEISKLSSKEIKAYKNEKIEYFKLDDNLGALFIDYDNAIEEKKSLANNALLIEELNLLKSDVDSKTAKGLTPKEINSYRAKLFRLSKLFESVLIGEEYNNIIIALQEKVNNEAIKPSEKKSPVVDQTSKRGNNQNKDSVISKAVSFYEISPVDETTLLKHLTGLYYLSLSDNSRKANVDDLWREKLVAILGNTSLRQYFKFNLTKNKEGDKSRVFIAISDFLFSFNDITFNKKLIRELLPEKTFLDKTNYQDPYKNIVKIILSL